MSTKAIDYKIILKRDGQTQQQRMPQWLDPALVPLDDRTKEDFFNYIREIAREINYYDQDETGNIFINGTWDEFFNMDEAELNSLAKNATLPPHIALWDAFITLYQYPQKLLNSITQRHLDFYYGDVLKITKNEPTSDKAHVVFELKKNSEPTLLQAGTLLLAGKDKSKKDVHYALTHDLIVNNAKVAQLKSVYINPSNTNFLHGS
jgi:hypothetical protein